MGYRRTARRRDVHRLRRHTAARSTDVRGNVATELEQPARRHEGRDQGRYSARRLRGDQGLRRLRLRRHRSDQQGVRRLHQRQRRHQRAHARAGVQEVPADPGWQARPVVALHVVHRGRQGLRGARCLHRLHRAGSGVSDQGAQHHPHRPRDRPAVDRRVARRADAHARPHQGARGRGAHQPDVEHRQAEGKDRRRGG